MRAKDPLHTIMAASRNGHGCTPEELALLRGGRALHMDHYGRRRLPYSCLQAKGLRHRLVQLRGPEAGRTFEVLDASGGYASASLGAGHPVVEQAVLAGIREAGYATDEIGSLERARMLSELFGKDGLWAERFPDHAYHVSGRNSGSEGMELALRLVLESRFDRRNLAYAHGREKRHIVLAFEGAWHGWTSGLVPLLNRRHFRVGLPAWSSSEAFGIHVVHLPFGDADTLEHFFKKHGSEILAVVIEPIQGDAGILIPPPGYLRFVSVQCRAYGALLVADEVLTFAKLGRFFGMTDEQGPIPTDISVIGKGLGMGAMSIAMVIARRALTLRASGAVATSDLRPLACAIIRQGLKHIVAEKLLQQSVDLGRRLRHLLDRKVVAAFPQIYQEVRGVGLLNGIELTEHTAPRLYELRRCLIENRVYVEFMAGAGRRSGKRPYVFPTMRVAPPLIVSDRDIEHIVERISLGTRQFVEAP